MEQFRTEMVALAHRQLTRAIRERAWAALGGGAGPDRRHRSGPAWLDAGQPDADHAADRIRTAIMGVIEAARRR